ncbi:3-phosphoserine/phosphohydroxythreonine transaminase [Ideonella oryzae]|uniref:Phosphoserine aminotransferase n=1 Tax=Ideonella oryzae TaxID=2937441 RepID=A0ABT1BKC1_9BURK|nr:3-phosphoserine/phosphohydroxythreonine transaminase [Ideonella oryzae]MCO5976659.1 3-phosphoserine/phosphohydroxythreonine transaminase [Ideonella oryzae]
MSTPHRPYNFSAGPAVLPEEVLRQAAEEMLDWHGSGMSVMEMSHRGKEFISIYEDAERTVRALLQVPANFRILFMQGGGLGENAIVPMNLSRGGLVDVVVTGSWSQKSLKEAGKYADARAAASNEADGHHSLPAPAGWQLRDGAAYAHICSNETIHGIEYPELPDLAALGSTAPLVVDASSHILSRGIDWSRVGALFAGAQKNIGPAGVTLVFVREDLLDRALPICPSAFNYKLVAENQSMFNTPPTYGIYIAGLVFQWVQRQGGVPEMERRAIARSTLVYDALDHSDGFYRNPVAPAARSRMNIPFFLADESLNDAFLAGAREAGLLQLKGHKSVGGMRASLYNAMPLAGAQALVDYLQDFARRHG